MTCLQVGTADLDDVLKLLRLRVKRVPQLGQGRKERVVNFRHSGDVHRSGEAKKTFSGAEFIHDAYTTYVSLLLWLMLT